VPGSYRYRFTGGGVEPRLSRKEQRMYPVEYRYTREHEWVSVNGKVATVGITDYAQHELGDIVYVELPEVGTRVEAGQPFGTVESVKSVSEVYSPVTGRVIEVNAELTSAPERINQDPHGTAWLIRVEMENPGELDALMDATGYQNYIAEQQKDTTA
jgi:glycine cleavage system H protein